MLFRNMNRWCFVSPSRKWLILSYIPCMIFICEYFIYYLFLNWCSWPTMKDNVELYSEAPTKVLVLADPHLLGPIRGHPFDRFRREWQMKRAFQAALVTHSPDVVFILGDIFDEGMWINEEQFEAHLQRYRDIFNHDPKKTVLKNAVGNHDIGFHHAIHPYIYNRFRRTLTLAQNSSSVRLWTYAGVHYVLANSMAFEGDDCDLCSEADRNVRAVSLHLRCAPKRDRPGGFNSACPKLARNGTLMHAPYMDPDSDTIQPETYTRPVLLQHFPLYRPNELQCDELPADAMPLKDRSTPYRLRWDCLSKGASQRLLRQLRPRLVLSGHSHYACQLEHSIPGTTDLYTPEWSVASFSWRNLPHPSFILKYEQRSSGFGYVYPSDVTGHSRMDMPKRGNTNGLS